MRKYETIKDLETIKRMAIAGWPMRYETNPITSTNDRSFVTTDRHNDFMGYRFENLDFGQLDILPPEIPLKEARERIKSGVVYMEHSKGFYSKRFWQVANFGDGVTFNQDGGKEPYHVNGYSNEHISDCIFYPFDPSQFADLLEDVEEEKADERPELFHFKGNFDDDSNYLNGHLERIYSELDELKSVCAELYTFEPRLDALEGKK